MNKHTAGYDQLMRFWLDSAPARGVVARLDDSLRDALQHHEYPAPVASLLRQLAGAAVLLASNLKQKAQVVLQAQGSGDVPLLCVEATDALTFRLYANVRDGAQIAPDAGIAAMVDPDGQGRFVLTISPAVGQMYQGIVELRDGSVATLLQEYLSNSQQTETRLWLREDGDVLEAMLLERLPDASPVATPDSAATQWNAVVAQVEHSFAQHFMPFPYDDWLQFVFAGHQVKVHPAQGLGFACACSIERVLNALKLVGEAELMPLVEEQGRVETRCEFCGKRYEIDAATLSDLFRRNDAAHPPGSATLQ